MTGKPSSGKAVPDPSPEKTLNPAKFTFVITYVPGVGKAAAAKEQRADKVVARPMILKVSWTMDMKILPDSRRGEFKASFIEKMHGIASPA